MSNDHVSSGDPIDPRHQPDSSAQSATSQSTTSPYSCGQKKAGFPRTPTLPTSENTQVFKPFKKFPPEIREAIWEFAASEPRVVEFEYSLMLVELSPELEPEGTYREEYVIRSDTLSPAILHTSQQGRRVGKKHYEQLRTGGVKDIYINWGHDIIFYRDSDCFRRWPYMISALGGFETLEPLGDLAWNLFYQIREKCVRLGLTDRQMEEFVWKYDHRYHFKKLSELLVFPKALNGRKFERKGGDVILGNMNKRTVSVSATRSWEHLQKRPEVEVPKHLKASVKYVNAVRNRDRLKREEGD